MNVDLLIAKLLELKARHESYPDWEETLGPLNIHIDTFQWRPSGPGRTAKFVYTGVSPNIDITHSDDGVYTILTAKESFQNYDTPGHGPGLPK